MTKIKESHGIVWVSSDQKKSIIHRTSDILQLNKRSVLRGGRTREQLGKYGMMNNIKAQVDEIIWNDIVNKNGWSLHPMCNDHPFIHILRTLFVPDKGLSCFLLIRCQQGKR